jgi:hypothetical protein
VFLSFPSQSAQSAPRDLQVIRVGTGPSSKKTPLTLDEGFVVISWASVESAAEYVVRTFISRSRCETYGNACANMDLTANDACCACGGGHLISTNSSDLFSGNPRTTYCISGLVAGCKLCSNQIGDEGAGSLAGVLPQCPKLRYLCLNKNRIANEGARLLAGVQGLLSLRVADPSFHFGKQDTRYQQPRTFDMILE